MQHPHGYTNLDVITAMSVVIFAFAIVVLLASPFRSIEKMRDSQRDDGVRDLTEILLEMQYREPETFAQIVDDIQQGGRSLIGASDDCSGSYGTQCSDSILNDTCLNIVTQAVPRYISSMPIDPQGELFDIDHTGYFLDIKNNQLIIGACNPERVGNIELKAQLQ
jgi:hypothetical protein